MDVQPGSWFHPSMCSRLQGVENAVCILRNLSYQLYNEIPPSIAMRLEGPTRDQSTGKGDAIGCFTPNSRKTKNVRTHVGDGRINVYRAPLLDGP